MKIRRIVGNLCQVWLILMVMAALTPAVSAELEIAVVDIQRLWNEAPQTQAAKNRLDEEFEPRRQSLQQAQESLASEKEAFRREVDVMSPERRQAREEALLAQQTSLLQRQRQFQEDFQSRRSEVLSRTDQQLRDAIKVVAEAEGYDIVLFDGVAYAREGLDVTDKVLARLSD